MGAVNIRIHPHSPERYELLLGDAFSLKKVVALQSHQRMIMARLDMSQREHGVLRGTLARFTEIDPDLPWFNAVRFAPADEDEVRRIQIPQNLRPNYMALFFTFHIHEHLLIFEHRGAGRSYLSPQMAMKFFEGLFSDDALSAKFGPVAVSMVADRDQLEAIIGIPDLKRLRIYVKRPNPDDLGDYDTFWENKLVRQGANSIDVVYEAEGKESIRPDEETRQFAELATRNGEIEAVGIDADGNRVERSTREHPTLEPLRYDPEHTTHEQAFRSAALTLVKRIMSSIL
ncbi:DUF4747 family protein [Falsiroseomonas sp. E2-1-a20]|uniref:DUF4747 family protein n=1 Tax=Falsiroseomonas sp. E2-1-a20 TaxID=3239300 RepID=UPI003F2F700B